MNNESATERGINPYLQSRTTGESDTAGGDLSKVYDPRAKGVDGDMLDAMMKGRWQEGHETGYEDGHQAARQRYPGIFDEGFRVGHKTGADEAAAEVFGATVPLLDQVAGALDRIIGLTGSEQIKEICENHLAGVRRVLERTDAALQAAGGAEPPTDTADAA
jgi:hypothetical protein